MHCLRLYPDLPPPSYSESVWGVADVSGDDEHQKGATEFTPRYVTYYSVENSNYTKNL